MSSPPTQSLEATEAVNNLILLSRHTPMPEEGCVPASSSPRSSNSKTIRLLDYSVELEERMEEQKGFEYSISNNPNDSTRNLSRETSFTLEGATIQNINEPLRNANSDAQSSSETCQNNKIVRIIKASKTERETGKKLYRCSGCDYASDFTSKIYEHMESWHKSCNIEKLQDEMSRHDSDKSIGALDKPVVRVEKASKLEIARGEKRYKCSLCGKSGGTIDNLYRHMESAHRNHRIEEVGRSRVARTIGKVVKIERCSEEEIAEGAKAYKCSECGKGSDSTGDLYAHMDISHPKCFVQFFKPPVQVEASSDQVSDSSENIIKVISATHNGKLVYKCSQCYVICKSTGNLYKHMRRQHKGCVIVKKDKVRGWRIKNIPKKNLSFECSVCMKIFGTNEELDIHIKIHDGENSNDCDSLMSGHSSNHFGVGDKERDNDEDISEERDESKDGEISEEAEGVVGNIEIERVGSGNESRTIGEGYHNSDEMVKHTHNSLHRKGTNFSGSEKIETGQSGDLPILDQSGGSPRVSTRLRSPRIPSHDPTTFDGELRSESNHDRTNKIVKIIKTSTEERNNGEDMYRCSLCDTTSNHTSNLYKHMRYWHKGFTVEMLTGFSRHGTAQTGRTPTRNQNVAIHEPIPSDGELESASNHGKKKQIVKIIKTSTEERNHGEDMYRCSLCDTTSNHTSNLYKHMRYWHKDFTVEKITESSRCATTQEELTPITITSQVIPSPEPITSDDEYGSESNFGKQKQVVKIIKASIEDRNNGADMYRCSQCDKTSNHTTTLYRHMRIWHGDCTIKKITKSSGYRAAKVGLTGTRRRGIPNSEPMSSDDELGSDSSYGNRQQIVKIIKASTEERNNGEDMYRCSLCYTSSNSTSNLYKHMRYWHAKFTIEKISESPNYRRPGHKELAIMKECADSGDNLVNNFTSYECSVCMEIFGTCEELDVHVRIHDGENSNDCDSLMSDHSSNHFDVEDRERDNDEDITEQRDESRDGEISEGTEGAVGNIEIERVGDKSRTIGEGYQKGSDPNSDKMVKHTHNTLHQNASNFSGSEKIEMGQSGDLPILDQSGGSPRVSTRLRSPRIPSHDPTTFEGELRSESNHDRKNKIVKIIKTSREERNNGEDMYRCSLCDRTSNNTSNLYKHMKHWHKGFTVEKITGFSRYGITQMRSNQEKQIVKIIKTSTEERNNGADMYRCSQCDETDNHTTKLYRHMKIWHKDFTIEKISSLEPKTSNDKLWSESNYGKDNQIVKIIKATREERKSGKDMYRCSLCNRTANCTSHLYKHMRASHKGFTIEKITESSRNGNTHVEITPTSQKIPSQDPTTLDGELESQLDGVIESQLNHPQNNQIVKIIKTSMEERNNGADMYRCSLCDRTGNHTNNLYKHMRRIHKGFTVEKISRFSTDMETTPKAKTPSGCGDKIAKIIIVPQDQRREEGKKYRCSECGHSNDSTSDLYLHMRTEHQGFIIQRMLEKDDEPVLDPNRTVRILKIPHSQRQRGEKLFQCSYCGFGSHFMGSVSRHIRNDHRGFIVKGMKIVHRVSSRPSELYNSNGDKIVKIIRTSFPDRIKGIKMYRCSQCHFTNNSTSKMYRHMRNVHTGYVIVQLHGNRHLKKDLCAADG